MDLYIFMGIMDELQATGKDLTKYTLKDIKSLYKECVR